MDRKQVSYSFVSTGFLGNKTKLYSFQSFISQRGCLTIYMIIRVELANVVALLS